MQTRLGQSAPALTPSTDTVREIRDHPAIDVRSTLYLICKHLHSHATIMMSRSPGRTAASLEVEAPPPELARSDRAQFDVTSRIASSPAHHLESQGYPGAPNQTRVSTQAPTLEELSGPTARVLSLALRAADRWS